MATAEEAAAYRASLSPEQRAVYLAKARERNARRDKRTVRASTRSWRVRYPERYKRSKRISESARRARKLGQFLENVDPEAVYQMFGGACGVCGEFIEGDFHVDHVLPLARGGLHGYVNVQPAHPLCNVRKGCRTAT